MCHPFPITPESGRLVLAAFLEGRHRSPEQYVSEARRRHIHHTDLAFDAATSLVIKYYALACERGIGTPKAKEHFAFEEEANTVRVRMHVHLVCGGSAKVAHVTFDQQAKTDTWLLLVSKLSRTSLQGLECDPRSIIETTWTSCPRAILATLRHRPPTRNAAHTEEHAAATTDFGKRRVPSISTHVKNAELFIKKYISDFAQK